MHRKFSYQALIKPRVLNIENFVLYHAMICPTNATWVNPVPLPIGWQSGHFPHPFPDET